MIATYAGAALGISKTGFKVGWGAFPHKAYKQLKAYEEWFIDSPLGGSALPALYAALDWKTCQTYGDQVSHGVQPRFASLCDGPEVYIAYELVVFPNKYK